MAIFDERELLRMAIQDEETGMAFYKALAAKTKLPHIQAQIIAIEKQEEFHRERFQKMLDELGGYKPQGDAEGEYEEYLRALLETRAYTSPEKAAAAANNARSDADAIDIALRLERDTLNFLNEVRTLVPEAHTAAITAVLQEERAHLTELAKMKHLLKPQ